MRSIILVIDGLGVGYMDDILQNRIQDKGANTYASLSKYILKNNSEYKNLKSLQISQLDNPKQLNLGRLNLRVGKSKLNYFGADSFLGHKEMTGIKIRVKPSFISEQKDQLNKLFGKEYKLNWINNNSILVINDSVFVTNNIESDLGTNINVVGNLDKVSFSQVLQIGQTIRDNFEYARVITEANNNITEQVFLKGLTEKINSTNQEKVIGVANGSIPNFYSGNFQSSHLGYADNNTDNLISRFLDGNLSVSLIGKTADLFANIPVTYKKSLVDTEETMNELFSVTSKQKDGLIFINFREIDLSGHQQDISRSSKALKIIDDYIPKIIESLADDDLLIITADHGNDPNIGHSQHTREYVPVIAVSQSILPAQVGIRKSLSDIAATVLQFHSLKAISNGESFI
jgi:phosphopentomutase